MTEERALTTAQVFDGLRTVRSVLAPDLSDDELKLFAMVANRSGLDPFAKQVYAVKRKGRVTFQTGIDGYRSIAARTGLYDGQDEPEYGPACPCGGKPQGHPEFATVRVYRKGVGRAIAATAYWHEYVPQDNSFMWERMPRVMLAKVAEALALRKAFPYDPENRQGIGADIYTADEMAQADRTPRASQPSLAEKAAEKRASVQSGTTQGGTPYGVDDEEAFADLSQEASFVEVDADATAEPEAAPEQPAGRCDAVSPYGDDSTCEREAGHKGNHRTADKETW